MSLEKIVGRDMEFSVIYDIDRYRVKIDSVWLVKGDKEVEVTDVMSADDMSWFLSEIEEDYQEQ